MKHLSEIQIDREALLHNWNALRHLAPPQAKRAAVVKGNAYGHGLREVVGVLENAVDYFQVDDVEELAELRRSSQKPTLVLGYIPRSQVADAVAMDAEIAIYDIERLAAIAEAGQRLGKRPRVHLKVDALLGRQGVLPDGVQDVLSELCKYPVIELAAVYSHFANIEDTTDLTHAQAQSQVFEKSIELCQVPRHESATSALMAKEHADSPNGLVRLGIGIYGLYPSAALAKSHADLGLQPAMRWVSHLAQVKTLPARHPVGYGLTYITPNEMRIGIVPQGYSDGYDRGLSSSGHVLVGGKRCQVLGRVAMNMFAIDLSGVPDAKAEDEVVLLGRQGGEAITAEELALRIGTINYEITTRISPLLSRVVI